MNLSFIPEEEAFREEVRDFLADHLSSSLRAYGRRMTSVYATKEVALEWQAILVKQGWAAPSWPVSYGGTDWTPAQRYIYDVEMARAGAPHGTLVVAGEQTQGRGRRGRGWSSPPGTGAWFSLIVRPPIAPAQAQGVALLTALAASEACEAACGLRPGIKWPNDLVLGDRKCCGILLEMAAEAERVNWVVLGVGVNVRQAEADFPPELRERAVSLSMAAGKPVSRASVIQGFVQALWARWDAFVQAGIPSFMEDYAARSVTLGRTVRVEQAAESFVGVAEALGAQGELLVRTQPGELRPVWAGDVSVRGLMGYV